MLFLIAPLNGQRFKRTICEVSVPTLYRWLSEAASENAERTHYKLTERDKLAFFESCGVAAVAFRLMVKRGEGAPPSLATYRRALDRELDTGTQQAARTGAAGRQQLRIALRDRVYGRNARWEADHTQLEVEVILPGRNAHTVRPWLTWIIDAGTRYIGGWAISPQPTRGEVLATIRTAVELNPIRGPFHGIPDMLVWDNGLEFTANAVTLRVA